MATIKKEENIIELLRKNVENKVVEQSEVNWEQLQRAAKIFLNHTQTFRYTRITREKISKIAKINEMKGYDRFSSDYIKTAKASKTFYRALFRFDEILSKYLKELPKEVLYVAYGTDGKPKTYLMSMRKLANLSLGRGRLGELNTANLRAIEDQIDKNSKDEKEHMDKGAYAVMGVNNRLARFYESRIDKEAQRQAGLLMWKDKGKWQVAKVTNQGVIDEAYTSFLTTRHNTKKDYLFGIEAGNEPYYNHNLIGKFYKYMATVTNMPAIVEEDIYTEWAQYAVKGNKAGLPSPEQYIRVAYSILSSKDEISPENLKEMIRDAFKKDSHLAPFIGEFLDEEIEKGIKKIIDDSGIKEAKISELISFIG